MKGAKGPKKGLNPWPRSKTLKSLGKTIKGGWGVTLKTFLPCILLCYPSGCLETIFLSSHPHSLSSIFPLSHSSPIAKREVLLQARAWWPISTKRYNFCFILFIWVFITSIFLQVYGLKWSCRSPLLYAGSRRSLTHNLVCRGVSFFFDFCFVFQFCLFFFASTTRNPIDGR